MPPWSEVLPCGVGRDGPIPPPSAACEFHNGSGLGGGLTPPHWGAVQMQWPAPADAEAAARECCGYCRADPDCAGAVVSGPVAGGTCSVFHAPPGAPPLRLLNGTAGDGKTTCMKR